MLEVGRTLFYEAWCQFQSQTADTQSDLIARSAPSSAPQSSVRTPLSLCDSRKTSPSAWPPQTLTGCSSRSPPRAPPSQWDGSPAFSLESSAPHLSPHVCLQPRRPSCSCRSSPSQGHTQQTPPPPPHQRDHLECLLTRMRSQISERMVTGPEGGRRLQVILCH